MALAIVRPAPRALETIHIAADHLQDPHQGRRATAAPLVGQEPAQPMIAKHAAYARGRWQAGKRQLQPGRQEPWRGQSAANLAQRPSQS